MLGLAMREAAECKRCGSPLHETTDYEYQWVPQPPIVCLRCAAMAKSEKDHHDHPQHTAMIHRVAKRPRPQPKKRKRRG